MIRDSVSFTKMLSVKSKLSQSTSRSIVFRLMSGKFRRFLEPTKAGKILLTNSRVTSPVAEGTVTELV